MILFQFENVIIQNYRVVVDVVLSDTSKSINTVDSGSIRIVLKSIDPRIVIISIFGYLQVLIKSILKIGFLN